MIPVPDEPQYPPKDWIDEPTVKGIPLVSSSSSVWKQMVDWLPFRQKKYILMDDYYTWSYYLQAWIWIPKNFVYNGASVPRIPFALFLRPDGILYYGSLPHDFGRRFDGLFLATRDSGPYTFTPMSKKKIDKVFDGLNQQCCKLRFLTKAAYWAVAAFDSGPGGMKVEDQDWTKPVYKGKSK